MTKPEPWPLKPLPIKVRLFHGENAASYARRLAEANSMTARQIENAVLHLPHPLSTTQKSECAQPLWRILGALHADAFDDTETQEFGSRVNRQLCLKCTAGQPATGHLPSVGHVCIRHKWWFGEPQTSLHSLPEVVTAERKWRKVLTRRRVDVFSRTFDLAIQAAVRAAPERVWGQRQATLGNDKVNRELLVYPESVKLACLITDTHFLDRTFAMAPRSSRYLFVQSAITEALGFDEAWMAVDPIWQVLNVLYSRIGEVRGEQRRGRPDDSPWDLFRHWGSCPDHEFATSDGSINELNEL